MLGRSAVVAVTTVIVLDGGFAKIMARCKNLIGFPRVVDRRH